jgi:hypothetical protein
MPWESPFEFISPHKRIPMIRYAIAFLSGEVRKSKWSIPPSQGCVKLRLAKMLRHLDICRYRPLSPAPQKLFHAHSSQSLTDVDAGAVEKSSLKRCAGAYLWVMHAPTCQIRLLASFKILPCPEMITILESEQCSFNSLFEG